ncbi:MAG: hypothetical protein HY695_10785 [Deltaproteobacteria bacterium]|nr:hypothetical protein [Deltaproteobacteria bacterium]
MSNPIMESVSKHKGSPRLFQAIGEPVVKIWTRVANLSILLENLGVFGLAVSGVIWVSVVSFGPYFKANESNMVKLENGIKAVTLASSILFAGADVRVEPRFGNSLRLYVPRKYLEDTRSSDRKRVTKKIAKAWCTNVEKTFLPRLFIYDAGDGDWLAGYSCIRLIPRTIMSR